MKNKKREIGDEYFNKRFELEMICFESFCIKIRSWERGEINIS